MKRAKFFNNAMSPLMFDLEIEQVIIISNDTYKQSLTIRSVFLVSTLLWGYLLWVQTIYSLGRPLPHTRQRT